MHVIIVNLRSDRKKHLCYHSEEEAHGKAIEILRGQLSLKNYTIEELEDCIHYDMVTTSYQKKEVRE